MISLFTPSRALFPAQPWLAVIYLLAVELTLVLDLDLREMNESPQLTTPPLLVILKVLSR